MGSNGWVKIHRSIWDGDLRMHPNAMLVFQYLIQRAQWDEGKASIKWGNEQYYLKRGEILTSWIQLNYYTGLARQSVRTALAYLEKTGKINQRTNHQGTIIFICNYDTYQLDLPAGQPTNQPTGNQRVTNDQPTGNHIIRNNKLTKEEGKKESIPAGPKGPTPGSLVWTSYCVAYKRRYGQEPTRNAKGNALCSQFVKRVGIEDSPLVIDFYVTHNDRWYVQKCHSLEYAIKDAEKLHMEWKNGRQMTSIVARRTELQGSNDDAFKEHFRKRYGE